MGLCMGGTLAVMSQNAQKLLRKCLSGQLSVHRHATGEDMSAQVGASRTIVATRSRISRSSIAAFGSCFKLLATGTHHNHSIDHQLRKSWRDKKRSGSSTSSYAGTFLNLLYMAVLYYQITYPKCYLLDT